LRTDLGRVKDALIVGREKEDCFASGVQGEAQLLLVEGHESARRQEHGPNRLRATERRAALEILRAQFRSIIIVLLLAAAALSFSFGDLLEGLAIVAVILINTSIGFATELRAVRSIEALRKLGLVETTVRRDGRIRRVPAEHLVPGDIVLLEGGDIVTADLRLVDGVKLGADESTLTVRAVVAAASRTGAWALGWQPWNAPWVPRRAAYSMMMPGVGPSVPAGASQEPTNAVSRSACPVSTVKPWARRTLVSVWTVACSWNPTSGCRPM